MRDFGNILSNFVGWPVCPFDPCPHMCYLSLNLGYNDLVIKKKKKTNVRFDV